MANHDSLKQRQEQKLEAVLLERLKDSDNKAFNIEDVRKELAKRLSKTKKQR